MENEDNVSKPKWFSSVAIVISNVFTIILFALIIVLVFFLVTSRGENGTAVGNYRFMTVLTGSMEPVIPTGSFIAIKWIDPDDIVSGDVITFRPDDENENTFLTHRVVEVLENNSGFITKGDANTVVDSISVKPEDVVGKYLFTIPLIGLITYYFGSTRGIVFFVVIIALLFLLVEVIKGLLKK